jgi:predicted nucleotidyltransferase
MKTATIPAWLDKATSALVEDTIRMLIKRHGNILLAVILFGSIARHEERLLDDSYPSDVDLLAIFDTTDRLVKPYREDIFATIIDAYALHLDAPREVNVLLSDRTMRTWDSMFLDNVAREGILLYAPGPLPAPLVTRQSLQERFVNEGITLS